MNLDINNPEHNPEEIWGKFYFNYDKKQHFFSIHSKHGFIVEDVATFWGVRKDKVQDIIAVDHTYELLLKSWEQCGWIKSETHFMNINKTDAHQSFDYYREVITPGIARSVSAAYRERIAVYGT